MESTIEELIYKDIKDKLVSNTFYDRSEWKYEYVKMFGSSNVNEYLSILSNYYQLPITKITNDYYLSIETEIKKYINYNSI